MQQPHLQLGCAAPEGGLRRRAGSAALVEGDVALAGGVAAAAAVVLQIEGAALKGGPVWAVWHAWYTTLGSHCPAYV